MRLPLLNAVAGLLLAITSCVAHAQAWPEQPIRIVVPFTPGTGMDTIARTVSPRLSERLGQPVVVQNMPGASGNIGADAVAKAPADGYTLLMGANTMLMASQLYKQVPFDPVKDFSPVSMAAYGTLMLVANAKTGIKSMQELISRAKAQPGAINYGSPGVGTPHHMAMELFKAQAQLFMLHVPYRGTAGYTQDLLSGEIMVGFLPIHVAQGFVNSGRLTALAVGSPKRHPGRTHRSHDRGTRWQGRRRRHVVCVFRAGQDTGGRAGPTEHRDRRDPEAAGSTRGARARRPRRRRVHTGRTRRRGQQGFSALGRGHQAQRHQRRMTRAGPDPVAPGAGHSPFS